MPIPADLKYSDTHEWIRRESDGSVTVGQNGIEIEREDGSVGHLKWPPASP